MSKSFCCAAKQLKITMHLKIQLLQVCQMSRSFPNMPSWRVRRSLKLEASEKDKHTETPLKTNLQVYPFSPATGACPLPSTVKKGNNFRQDAQQATDVESVPEKASRGQLLTDGNADVIELFKEMEESLEAFMKMRQKLKNLKTLEGSRELEILFGFSESSSDLKTEMQRAKFLISEARKMKMLQ
eukprot:XP_017949052.1 PREDICTED: centromere protein R isoform X1 [Xenopus tropicalis]